MNRFAIAAAVGLLGLCGPLLAADKVKLLQGSQSTGKLTTITPTEVAIEIGSNKKTFPVNEIDSISFDSEPNDLTQARIAVHAGRFDDAVTMLGKINMADIKRPELLHDVEFFKGVAAARLALAGTGSKAEAGRTLVNFEKANKNSFHYFAACETLGDLLVAMGKYDQAETYYKKLTEAPWPDYQMRSAVLIGRAWSAKKSSIAPSPGSTKCRRWRGAARKPTAKSWPPRSARPRRWPVAARPTKRFS